MKSKIFFVWQGINGRYGHWQDGLWRAMKRLEQDYDITYHEPTDDLNGADLILYWEAPITIRGENAHHYMNVMNQATKKILLFAGGPIKQEWVKGFDLLCVESKINQQECDNLGIPAITAFGINEDIFFPQDLPKVYDGIHQGTCASWKRQELFGRALKEKGIVVGRDQESDSMPFRVCRDMGTTVMLEQSYEKVAELLNQSHVMVQTSNEYGGGQRATLEAFACDIPVICMKDSPKNREYVEESGCGYVIEPHETNIYQAVKEFVTGGIVLEKGAARKYIESKWTSKHYAQNLKKAIEQVLHA